MFQVFKPERLLNFKSFMTARLLLLFSLLCLAAMNAVAQKKDSTASKFKLEYVSLDNDLTDGQLKIVKRADFIYSMGPLKYERALKEYMKALETSPDNSFLNFKVGFCYLHINKSKSRSILYLEKALNIIGKKVDPKIRYYLAEAYQVNHNPDRAIEEYKKYIQEVKKELKPETKGAPLELVELSRLQEKDISQAYKKIDECKNLQNFYKHPTKARLKNMGDSINSPFADYDPFISLDESNLYFTSRRSSTKGGGKAEVDGEYYEDIYVSHKKNGKWEKAKPLSGMNKNTNDAITGLSTDGTKMFIYRDINGGDIYISEFKGTSWSKPRNLKDINSEFHESAACLSADNKTLYFVSDRPGGEGGRDIYMSTLDEAGNWSKPVNLGSDINTTYDEDRVYVHPYTKALFFSSKGHNSLGGYDIFTSDFQDGKWTKPKNLGYPINDVDDDFSFVITDDLKHGYYSSFKENGKGDKDIYFIDFENINGDTTLQSIEAGLRQGAIQDSIDARLAFNQAHTDSVIKNNPAHTLATLDPRQISLLDSLAKRNGKFTAKILDRADLGVPLGTREIRILDSLAKTDHRVTPELIAGLGAKNSSIQPNQNSLTAKQIQVLDSIARLTGKITPELLQRANLNNTSLSSRQVQILDSLAKSNHAINTSALNKTNFAKPINAHANEVALSSAISSLSNLQVHVLDSIAKANGTINATLLAQSKLGTVHLTTKQIHTLDSLAKVNGTISADALNKTDFAQAPMNNEQRETSSISSLTEVQISKLNSIAKADGRITSASLNEANIPSNAFTNQQINQLDSLAKTKGSITTADIKSLDAHLIEQNLLHSADLTTPHILNTTLNSKDIHLLDSLAKIDRGITFTRLASTQIDVTKMDPSDLHMLDSLAKTDKAITENTVALATLARMKQKNAAIVSSTGLTYQQLHVLDSIAKMDRKITQEAISKSNLEGNAFSKNQIEILDSLAKANGHITITALNHTNFNERNENTFSSLNFKSSTGHSPTQDNLQFNKHQIQVLDSLVRNSGWNAPLAEAKLNTSGNNLSDNQIRILDSLAATNGGINTSSLNKANAALAIKNSNLTSNPSQTITNSSIGELNLTTSQIKRLDSIAKSDGKISAAAVLKTGNNIPKLSSKQLGTLDSLAKADGGITTSAIKNVTGAESKQSASANSTVNANQFTSVTQLNNQQIHVLDSIAKRDGAITIRSINKTEISKVQLTSQQVRILDSLAKTNRNISLSLLNKTTFAGSNQSLTVADNSTSSVAHASSSLSNKQIHLLDSLAKRDGKITAESIYTSTNGSLTLNLRQVSILDSIAKGNKGISASSVAKTNFSSASKNTTPIETANNSANTANVITPAVHLLSDKQIRILDSLARKNKKITYGDVSSLDFAGANISLKQLHILDSLSRVNGKITQASLSKTKFESLNLSFAAKNNPSKNTSADIALSAKQIHILDSLANANQTISESALSNAGFNKQLNREQLLVLDSIAKTHGSFTATALAHTVTNENNKSNATLISNDKTIIPAIAINGRQLVILDSLAKINGSVTAKMLVQSKFGATNPNAQTSSEVGSNVSGTGLSKTQIRIIDSLARVNRSITISSLVISNFVPENENETAKNTVQTTSKANTGLNNQRENENESVDQSTTNKSTNSNEDKLTSNKRSRNKIPEEVDPADTVIFNPVLFEFNKATLSSEYSAELEQLTRHLKKFVTEKVRVTGYADAKGKPDYNLRLSLKRAQAVSTFLKQKGINEKRIKVDAKGESQPVAPNENPDKSDNPEGRKLNRRVEIKFTSR